MIKMFKRLDKETPNERQEVLLVKLNEQVQLCVYIGKTFNKITNVENYKFINNNRDYIEIQDYLSDDYV